jgi:hypothetical protein
LREAIKGVNASQGNTIDFAIPSGDPGCSTSNPPVCTITIDSALGSFDAISNPVTIDGYTQAGASPNSNGPGQGLNTVLTVVVDGIEAGLGTFAVNLTGDSTVRGLALSNLFAPIILNGDNNVIEGNFIGTDATGTVEGGGANDAINMTSGAQNNRIGGSDPGEANILSGGLNGIRMTAGLDTIIQGNYIGTDATGTRDFGNADHGVNLTGVSNRNIIGGDLPGEANIIAFNGGDGVLVIMGTLNRISANSIFSNVAKGISLNSGQGNNGLETPILSSADVSSATCTTRIQGILDTSSIVEFRVEFFSNPEGDEGKTFLGFQTVTTDGTGNATLDFTFDAAIPPGNTVTATAIDPFGDTSEFSAPVTVAGNLNPGTLQFSQDAYSVLETAGSATITVTREGGSDCPASIDFATSDGTGVAGDDYEAASGTLNWEDDDAAAKTFSVTVLGDPLNVADVTVNLLLSNPVGAALGDPGAAVLTIQDGSNPPDGNGGCSLGRTGSVATSLWLLLGAAGAAFLRKRVSSRTRSLDHFSELTQNKKNGS